MKIKLECEIEVNKVWYGLDKEEMEWFKSVLDDKENTMLILHSNDIGDTIGETFNFKYEIL